MCSTTFVAPTTQSSRFRYDGELINIFRESAPGTFFLVYHILQNVILKTDRLGGSKNYFDQAI